MKKYFNVTYRVSDDIWSANLAHAENENDILSYYASKSGVRSNDDVIISDANDYAVEDAQRRGKPIVEVEHVEQEQEQEQEQEAQEEAPKAPIKSTTREGKTRIRSYILSLYTEAGYDGQPEESCQDFPKVAQFIWDTFQTEKQYSTPQMWRQGMNYEAVFNDWCRGLPSVLDTCFCYNRSAVKEVQDLLCQTDEQVKKYSETMAEDYLIHLIYREVKHAVDYEQEAPENV